MEEIYAVPKDDESRKKKPGVKEWIKDKLHKGKCFWDENKEPIIALTPVVIGGITFLVKTISKHARINAEKDLKELYIYDPKLRLYWQLKRKLTTAQHLELERRKAEGESMGNILASMRVLKL